MPVRAERAVEQLLHRLWFNFGNRRDPDQSDTPASPGMDARGRAL